MLFKVAARSLNSMWYRSRASRAAVTTRAEALARCRRVNAGLLGGWCNILLSLNMLMQVQSNRSAIFVLFIKFCLH